ncbi:hypothetical protein [Pseudodesulfovibrio methanolicus]|uniref:Uncharacterized protein n=1 Tax=Pseudodesulfovibrio methanolicus TaxID=3126690 RepID=A0ABZ2ITV3_9BACT
MNLHLTDRIWNLLLKTAFGPLNYSTTNDLPANQQVIPYGPARHALNSLRGEMDEVKNESGTTLTVDEPMHTHAGIRKMVLRFNASQRLEGISITWEAGGSTFRNLKSWLDQEIKTAKCHRLGYDLACRYELNDARIELVGNPLGFGMSRKVTLSCFLGPGEKMAGMFHGLGKKNAMNAAA